MREGEILAGAAGQRRLLAILTVLAAVGERGISRDKLLALLWSEGEPDKSRHALTQSLYHIRKALGVERILLNNTDLRLNADVITSDVGDFQKAVQDGRVLEAIDVYGGPFLDGFHLNGDPEFDFWVTSERSRLSRQYTDALRSIADAAAQSGDVGAELSWRTRLVDHDPLDGAAVARLIGTMIAASDPAGALQRARTYEARMRDELDLPPDRAVVDLIAQLRRAIPNTAPVASAVPKGQAPEPRLVAHTDVSEPPATRPAESPRSAAVSAPQLTRRRARRREILFVAAGVLAGILIVTRVATVHLASARAAVRASTIMVAPFRIDSTEPATAYLREGLLDLLTTRLASADTKRAADPSLVLRAWRAAGYGGDSALSVTATTRIARALDAGEVVMGSVERSPSGVSVRASLVDVAHGRVKVTTTVSGSPDSLIVLTDRIISGLILTQAGDRLGAVPHSETVSPLGLRAYLAGRSAYRRADYYEAVRAQEQALAQDPDFALAALSLAMSADRANVAEQHDRGLALAWARQSELSPADRAYLQAFAGPRYPEPSSAAEALAAWERVVRVAPDRVEGWHELGESFYYDGELLGMHNGSARAAEAFRHALQLDPFFAPSRRMLSLLLARQRDTAGLRRLIASDSNPDADDVMRVFVRWRAANALGDARELARARRAFENAPNSALRAIAMTSQFDGVSIDDGDRALEILRRRPLSDAEGMDVTLARHSRALNSGNFAAALAITTELGARQPSLHPQLRLRILDVMYAGADRATAMDAAWELERLTNGAPPTARADSAVQLADVCVLAQWRMFVHDTAGARAHLRTLRSSGVSRFPVPVGANPSTCAELIDASLAVAERGVVARDQLAHVDSLMLSGPAVSDAMRYANIMIAREYRALGDPEHAVAVLQRRSYMRGWPRYRATGLRLLSQLSLEVGDTAAARSAYERYLATRRRPAVASPPMPFVSGLRRFSRRLVQ
jgi:DNA-binding SARP family transcriptional activator/tetratricopeptide (TPR) repeat protein/TolB-like protein